MNTLKELSKYLADAKQSARMTDARLAAACGLSRQSVARALSGHENFTATTLLAMADAMGMAVLLVPKEAAQALRYQQGAVPVRSAVDALRNL